MLGWYPHQQSWPVLTLLLFAIALALAIVGAPTVARAQAGWYATPSMGVTEEFDDNVFLQPSRERMDFITRLSPGLKAGFRSTPLTLEGSYAFDAEVYVNNPQLSDAANRKRAELDFRYLPIPVATLRVNAAHTETQTPTELLPETGITLERRTASQLVLSPSASYRFSTVTSGEASYSYTRGRISGGLTNTTQEMHLALGRQLTPLDKGALGYRLSLFASEGAPSTVSQALVVGWDRRLTERTLLTLEAGSRVSDGMVSPEVSARVDHRFKLGMLSASYSRSEAVVLGRAGTVKTESLLGSGVFEPLRFLRVSLAPSVRKSSAEEDPSLREVTVYELTATVSYRITKWVSARGEYRFSLQDKPVEISHNILSISLDLTYPVRATE